MQLPGVEVAFGVLVDPEAVGGVGSSLGVFVAVNAEAAVEVLDGCLREYGGIRSQARVDRVAADLAGGVGGLYIEYHRLAKRLPRDDGIVPSFIVRPLHGDLVGGDTGVAGPVEVPEEPDALDPIGILYPAAYLDRCIVPGKIRALDHLVDNRPDVGTATRIRLPLRNAVDGPRGSEVAGNIKLMRAGEIMVEPARQHGL